LAGPWMYWNEDGSTNMEVEYENSNYSRILNEWSTKGERLVKDGNGTYFSYYESGSVRESGKVVNRERKGIWKEFTESGQVISEAEYVDGKYILINSWDAGGKPMVRNRQGTHKTMNGDVVILTGSIVDGLKEGEWLVFSEEGDTLQRLPYVGGKENGPSKSFHPDGIVAREGALKDGEREGEWRWYHPNGKLECTITYVKGKKEGEQPFFDDEGNLSKTEVYWNGKLIEVRT